MERLDTEALGNTVSERHEEAAQQVLPSENRLYIGGAWVDSVADQQFEVENPTTERVLTSITAGQKEDVSRAVDVAQTTFASEWKDTSASERGELLEDIAEIVRQHRDTLAVLETIDNGKPIHEARADIDGVASTFEEFAGLIQYNHGRSVANGPNQIGQTVREPYGVVGLVVPWNFPLSIAAVKLAPAIAAGNTTVLKPAEQTPLSALKLMELADHRIPDGVVNVVPGTGQDAGAPLTSHPKVDKLSFTGSVPVGKEVMKSAADHVIDVTLELGGKSPLVVYPDVDVEKAATIARKAIFFNGGECCTAGSRLLVHEEISNKLLATLAEKTEELVIGDPLSENTNIGPKISAEQVARTNEFLEKAREANATFITEQKPPIELSNGHFVGPAIVCGVSPNHQIAREEVFGPVLTVFKWSDYDEMINLANGVNYGLAAGVLTRDVDKAYRTARDIESGYVWINEYHAGAAGLPTGGYKESGIGREGGFESLHDFTQTKSIYHEIDVFE